MTAMRLGLPLALIGTLAFVAAGCGDDGGSGGNPDGGGSDGAMADGGGSDGAAGDGGGGGVCDVPSTACGGDISGDWQLTDLCTKVPIGPLAGITNACPGATLTTDVSPTGTATFNGAPAMDYMVAFDIMATVSLELPASCLGSDAGVPSTCDALEGGDITCTGDMDTGCSCSGTFTMGFTDSGTYTTTAGGDLTLDSMTDGPSSSQYCVDGDSLRIFSDEIGTFVLERQ